MEPFRGQRARLVAIGLLLALALPGALWQLRSCRREHTRLALLAARGPNLNILLITIDTLRADHVGAYGGTVETPTIDRLARAGLRFDNAHAQNVVTLPSHANILTGLYPFQHGVRDNSGFRVRPGTATLATFLKARGYATGAFVGAFPLDSRFGLAGGFEVYDDRYGESNEHSDFKMQERPAESVVRLATAWIGAQQGRRWFCWVHLYDPHAPYTPPEPFRSRYRRDLYSGEIAYTDHALGPLVDPLMNDPAQRVLIVLTADHGEALGEHGELTHGLFAYEGTLRVPLILYQPRLIRPGATSLPARHIDIVPTVLDAIGVLPSPETPSAASGRSSSRQLSAGDSSTRGYPALPGRSLLVVAANESRAAAPPAYFESLSMSLNRGWAPLRGVISGAAKYIDLPIEELYDLARDAGEQHNLAGTERDRAAGLGAVLAGLAGTRVTVTREEESPEVAERLRALGYVAGRAPLKARYTVDDDPKRLVELDALMQRGIAEYQEGALAKAIATYEEVIRRRPGMPVAYANLGFLYWQAGRAEDATRTLREALAKGAEPEDARPLLGIYLAESGHATEAIRLLGPRAAAPYADIDELNALGVAYARAGRPEQAIAVFERILREDPSNASAYQNIGTVAIAGRAYARARDAFTRALAIDPTLARAHNGLGVIAAESGDQAGAIEEWQRAVALDPSQYDTLYNLGIVLRKMSRPEEARRYLEQFIRTAPPAQYARDIQKVKRMLRQ